MKITMPYNVNRTTLPGVAARLRAVLPAAALLTALLLPTACEQSEPAAAVDAPVALRLSSGIRVTSATRAYDSSWESGDQIGVFATAAGTATVTESAGTTNANVAYQTGAAAETWSGSSHSYQAFEAVATPIYLPFKGTDIDVYAYYPYAAGTSDASPLAISVPTVQTAAAQKAIDVMKASALTSASPINIDNSTATLLFEHCLSKVLVKVKAGAGFSGSDLSGLTLAVTGQPTAATFAPVSQTLTVTAGTSAITPLLLSAGDPDYDATDGVLYTYRALVLPNTGASGTNPPLADGTRQIVFTVSSGSGATTYHYTMTETLAAAQQTTYVLTLTATDAVVTAAIQPWTTTAVDSGELSEDEN